MAFESRRGHQPSVVVGPGRALSPYFRIERAQEGHKGDRGGGGRERRLLGPRPAEVRRVGEPHRRRRARLSWTSSGGRYTVEAEGPTLHSDTPPRDRAADLAWARLSAGGA